MTEDNRGFEPDTDKPNTVEQLSENYRNRKDKQPKPGADFAALRHAIKENWRNFDALLFDPDHGVAALLRAFDARGEALQEAVELLKAYHHECDRDPGSCLACENYDAFLAKHGKEPQG